MMLAVEARMTPASLGPWLVVAFCTLVTGQSRDAIVAREGTNVILHCNDDHMNGENVNWIWKESPASEDSGRFHPLPGRRLLLTDVSRRDSKLFVCQDAESNESIHSIFLQVNAVPEAVPDLRVTARSVNALITWSPPPDDGGLPIAGYQISYRRDKSHIDWHLLSKMLDRHDTSYDWKTISDIDANATSKTIYNLMPNTTYYFRMCAVNALGCGANVTVAESTNFVAKEVRSSYPGIRASEKDNDRSLLSLWLVVFIVILTAFAVIGVGISFLIVRNWSRHRGVTLSETTEDEAMELVPHITLNPSFNIEMLEYIETSNEGHEARKHSPPGDDQHQLVMIDEGDEASLVKNQSQTTAWHQQIVRKRSMDQQ